MEKVMHDKKQAGRPVKAIKKEIRAGIRFTKAEYFIVRNKASKAGMKPSVYIREMVINGEVKMRLSEEERHFVRHLVGMSNNLNQLANNSYKEGMLKTAFYFETYRNRIDEVLKIFDYAK